MGPNRTRRKKKGNASSFNEAALAQLTAKLDTSLPKSGGEAQGKRKRSRDADDRPGSSKRHAHTGADRKLQEHEGRGDGRAKKNLEVLRDEILALGGDEDDYELVAGVDSDAENAQDTPRKPSTTAPDDCLREELAKFASTLGFEHVPHNDDVDTDTAGSEETESSDEEPMGDFEGGVEAPSGQKDVGERREVKAPTEGRPGKSNGKMVFEPRPDWHSLGVEDTRTNASAQILGRYAPSVAKIKDYANDLLDQDSAAYTATQSSSSTQKFMSTIMSSGTLSDKVSALTLSIQESPVHCRKAFENLISLAGKKSRGQAIASLGALVDLLGNGAVLPGDRRLRPFSAQPALLAALQEDDVTTWAQGQQLPSNLTQVQLVMWAYEDWLKGAFFRIIQLLEVWCSDEIEYSRSRALDFVFGLLRSKPEQEANLLRILVNKLGDRERKIASRASYLILQLLESHPGMKLVVVNAVEQEVLLKPAQSLRAKYYAINTLNQTILSGKEPAVADNLLRIYFETFVSLLKSGLLGSFDALENEEKTKKHKMGGNKPNRRNPRKQTSDVTTQEQESTQKLVSSLLTGVNRALPFTTTDDTTLEKHIDTLFRITHSSNFNTSVQALMLIQQLAASKFLAVDRFYRTLYESLLDPRLVTSSKQALYLNLLYRSMKNDVDVRRVKAFVKRLVQILGLHQPSFACGILFLISELEGTFLDLRALVNVPEDTGDDEEEVYKDVIDKDATPASTALAVGLVSGYDGRKRNPEHSNAHRSCLWEIAPFLKHFHPSVSVFAANLLQRQKSLPKPDLENHTLMHFLDKFVYRNPKATDTKRGGSIMQPVLASDTAHVLVSSKATARQPAVNSASFWNLKSEDVSVEDAFFHEYFAKVGKSSETSKAKKAPKVDAGSDDEEAEEEIWEALVNSRPEVEGGGDDDDESDVDMEGYSDSEVSLGDGVLGTDALSDADSDGSGGFEGIFDDSGEDRGLSEEEEEEEEEEEHGAPVDAGRKKRLSRKDMRSLPTFASVDDYAEMLAGDEEGN
ncbi:hypothetical protein OQA88_10379 [Cercophora sp. LCS_1]